MLKSVDKKAKRELSSRSPGRVHKVQSEVFQREIIPDEVNLTLEIKEVRYGRRQVNAPEITTMLNNSKVVCPVPFESPLKYSFKRTEDEMVFKFAVTSGGDLLGFIYMEIPQKFKTIKKFRLDDWFPVKMVQTQDQEKLKQENFVARVVINYESSRKLEAGALNVTPKTLKTQLAEDTQKNLRQKMDNIHEEVDAFAGEGFKHLEEFQKKLMTKKIKSTTALIEGGKEREKSTSKSPNRLLNTQKETFYKAQQTLGETDDLKGDQLRARQLYNRSPNASPDTPINQKTKSCQNCDNLLKELSYTRKELIEANQKITAFEERQMSVDNVKLKKQLEALQEALNKDRKELSLKLREHSTILEAERSRLSKIANEENQKAYSLQKEANSVVAECKARTSELRLQEAEMERRHSDFEMRLAELTKNENEYIDRMKAFLKERDEYQRDKEEWEEIKVRMMKERRRIYEEANKYQFLRADLGLKKEELQALDDYFGDEKDKFRREMDEKVAHIEKLKYELVKREEIFEMEQRHFNEQKKLLEEKNQRLNAEMSKVRTEAGRLAQMHSKIARDGEAVNAARESASQDHQLVFQEIEKDYEFLDQQLKIVEEQRNEIANMHETLAQYERTLEKQNSLHLEQQAKINVMANQLVQKLNSTDYDQSDVKRLVEGFAIEFKELEHQVIETQRFSRELDKNRASVRKSMAVISEKSTKALNLPERTSILERRNTKKFQEAIKFEKSYHNELKGMTSFEVVGPLFSDNQNEKNIKDLQSIIQAQQRRITELEGSALPGAQRSTAALKVSQQPASDADSVDQQQRIVELQAEIDRLFEQRLAAFRNSQPNKANPQKYQERIRAVENAQKTARNALVVLSQLNNLRVESLTFDGSLFDHEKLAAQYEKRIADLIEFIQRVKDNTDFFNNNMDNEILIR